MRKYAHLFAFALIVLAGLFLDPSNSDGFHRKRGRAVVVNSCPVPTTCLPSSSFHMTAGDNSYPVPFTSLPSSSLQVPTDSLQTTSTNKKPPGGTAGAVDIEYPPNQSPYFTVNGTSASLFFVWGTNDPAATIDFTNVTVTPSGGTAMKGTQVTTLTLLPNTTWAVYFQNVPADKNPYTLKVPFTLAGQNQSAVSTFNLGN